MSKKMTITFSDKDMDIYNLIKSHKSPSKFIINSLRFGSYEEVEDGQVKLVLADEVKDFIIDTIHSMTSSCDFNSIKVQDASSYEEDLFKSIDQFD